MINHYKNASPSATAGWPRSLFATLLRVRCRTALPCCWARVENRFQWDFIVIEWDFIVMEWDFIVIKRDLIVLIEWDFIVIEWDIYSDLILFNGIL